MGKAGAFRVGCLGSGCWLNRSHRRGHCHAIHGAVRISGFELTLLSTAPLMPSEALARA